MKRLLVYVLCGIEAIAACTTSKLKNSYRLSNQTESRSTSDSTVNEKEWNAYTNNNFSDYNALWWLKGNVRMHIDSGIYADEILLRQQGIEHKKVELFNNQENKVQQHRSQQLLAGEELKETYKEKRGAFRFSWRTYLIFLIVMLIFMRWLRKLSFCKR